MATYLELRSLFNDADLRNKVEVAVTIAAEGIATNSTNETTERVAWSQDALAGPSREADKFLRFVLAANSTETVSAIQSASDATLQSNVDAAVDALASGLTPGS